MALFSVAVGVYDLYKKNSLMTFDIDNESLKWLAIAWALHEAMPGMVFAGYVLHSEQTQPKPSFRQKP